EFSKTNDFNPSKTTYLIKLNYSNLANTIYKRIQKSIINIYHLKAKEHDENCTMLQKYSKIKQFIYNTTDPELRNGDIESFLTKNEQENLNSFKKNIEYLDLALLRISIPYIFFKAFLNI
ncbi:MAG: DNA-directed RNA polymerase III subunit RPC3, partial [Paramarteilia canceri]